MRENWWSFGASELYSGSEFSFFIELLRLRAIEESERYCLSFKEKYKKEGNMMRIVVHFH